MKPQTRQSISQKQQDSVEEVKKHLKIYSKFLRRDFLAILVKMCAKELLVRTVREDWRTRTGMLQFLQQNWAKFLSLVNNDTIFNWFCNNFESLEKILSNRKLVLFIYANWSQYSQYLATPEAIDFFKKNQLEIASFIEGDVQSSKEWMTTEYGSKFIEIYKAFCIAPTHISIPQKIIQQKPIQQQQIIRQPVTTLKADEMVFCPVIEDYSATEDDQLEIEDTFDVLPFEVDLHTISDLEYPSYQFDDTPIILDEFQL